MRPSIYSDTEMQSFVRDLQSGRPIDEICRVTGLSPRTLYRWQQRFGGLKPFGVQALRRLQQENRRLRAEVARRSAAVAEDGDRSRQPILRSDVGMASSPDGIVSRPTVNGRYASLRIR
ncbi:transposase [Labrys monachus]|uniref:AraC-like DNA-binding protein n=1 Tax=Labrys monachus TaxID=217067 RepID=A0ABU0F9J7_9HYPH|nr:transposase [Labrys monachus]MDQ0391096.1 AraC-like DNA-binding protein [Labrys monachus]